MCSIWTVKEFRLNISNCIKQEETSAVLSSVVIDGQFKLKGGAIIACDSFNLRSRARFISKVLVVNSKNITIQGKFDLKTLKLNADKNLELGTRASVLATSLKLVAKTTSKLNVFHF